MRTVATLAAIALLLPNLISAPAKAAEQALQNFPLPILITKGTPIGWLKAFIALRNGDKDSAEESLSAYLGRPLDDQEALNEALLLHIWDTPADLGEDTDLAFYFPTLPPSLTGLTRAVTRVQYSPSVLPRGLSSPSHVGTSESTQKAQAAAEKTQPTGDAEVEVDTVSDEFEEEIQHALLNTELRQLSRDEAAHLEKEFEDYDKRYPPE